jgi:predicted MFS family arabinose efflux permease
MQHELGWSRVVLTGAFSLAILVSGLASVSVGRLLDRYSPRVPMSMGSGLAVLCVFAWSRVNSPLELYVVFLGLGVAMALVLYEAAFIVITKWFSVRRSGALTTLTMISASASFIFSPLSDHLVRAYGWRAAVVVLALILAVVTIPIHALLLRPAPHRMLPPSAGTATPPTTRRIAMSRRSFWMIVAAFALSSFAAVAIVVHLVPFLIDAGSSPAAAAFAAGLLGLAQIPGRLLFVWSSRLLSAPANTVAVFGLSVAALCLLAANRSAWAVLVFVLCFGASNGMLILLRATLIADLYGHTNYGAISGIVSAFALTARAAAPLGGALIALAPGGSATMLLTLAALTCLAACAAIGALSAAPSSGGLRGGSAR